MTSHWGRCVDCGEPVYDWTHCRACRDRRDVEARIESGNEHRRQAQIALDLEQVRRKARKHYDSPDALPNVPESPER